MHRDASSFVILSVARSASALQTRPCTTSQVAIYILTANDIPQSRSAGGDAVPIACSQWRARTRFVITTATICRLSQTLLSHRSACILALIMLIDPIALRA